jgi:uncharacterized membrane protein YgaE (UPF0421/DUF939 family)
VCPLHLLSHNSPLWVQARGMRRPKLPWDSLEDWGISLQVVKTALAAGFSWAAASWAFHTPKPYFAPLAAILCLQATIAESLSRGVQRIAGVVAGIALAIVFTRWLGLNAWSLAFMVFVGMAAATRLKLGPQGIPQVAISALMVMAVGEAVRGYAWYRLFGTAIGAVVAIAVAGIVWPPDLTPEASQSLRILAQGLSELLEDIRRDVNEGLTPAAAERHLVRARAVASGLDGAKRGFTRAETSLRWNPWHRAAKVRLKRLGQTLLVMDHVLMQIRGISRTLTLASQPDALEHPAAPWCPAGRRVLLAEHLGLMADALREYGQLIEKADQEAAWRLEEALGRGRASREKLLADIMHGAAPDRRGWVAVTAMVHDLEKMSQDLLVSSQLIVPIVKPAF